LIDVNQLSDEQLTRQQWIGPLARAMKHIREIDITPYLLSILQELRWQTNDPVAKELLPVLTHENL
jgi:hypothetical protein